MSLITVAGFKKKFARYFTFGDEAPAISDYEVEDAIASAEVTYNYNLYPDDATRIIALYWLSAHFLYADINAADNGLAPAYQLISSNVDGVSVSNNIPQWMKEGVFTIYSADYFGQRWLMMTEPYLGGAVSCIQGGINP
jgi:hypothetical protein